MTDLNFDDPHGELAPEQAHALGRQLSAARPVPAAGFRGALGRLLAASDPGYGPRPAHLRHHVALRIGAGALLIILGALQALGSL